jgi:hypothetical protein
MAFFSATLMQNLQPRMLCIHHVTLPSEQPTRESLLDWKLEEKHDRNRLRFIESPKAAKR